MKNWHGGKIDGLSLSSMTNSLSFLVAIMMGGALSAAPIQTIMQESAAIQEMRLSLEQITKKLHSQSIELQLAQERALQLDSALNALKGSPSDKNLEKRLARLENANETLIADFKTLKNHLNETNTTLAQCQSQLNKIDKQLTSDIQSLKLSLNSMIALLQGGEQKTYTVQFGDSLGQIALDHKTNIKTLKELNNLTSDIIYSGQKLILP
jgi:LysM repeat protein